MMLSTGNEEGRRQWSKNIQPQLRTEKVGVNASYRYRGKEKIIYKYVNLKKKKKGEKKPKKKEMF